MLIFCTLLLLATIDLQSQEFRPLFDTEIDINNIGDLKKRSQETKMSPDLLMMIDKYAGMSADQSIQDVIPLVHEFLVVESDLIALEIIAGDVSGCIAKLQSKGATHINHFRQVVNCRFPMAVLSSLEGMTEAVRINLVRRPVTNIGAVTSQGDVAQFSDIARLVYGVNGTGNKIGVLSDSYDALGTAASDISTGDLPGVGNPNGWTTPVDVLSDLPGFSDEGRAMMQIVHDVAPGAELAFHTAFGGQADFAQGILDLNMAGCNIIVDDVFYLAEPYYMPGIVAQAVDQAFAAGSMYFSSAGNQDRDSYEAIYAPGPALCPAYLGSHEFAPGDLFLSVNFSPGNYLIVLQWDEPFYSVTGGANPATDLDLCVWDENLNFITCAIDFNNNGTGDAIEVLAGSISGIANFSIEHYSGPLPNRVKIIIYGPDAAFEFGNSAPTIVGHANTAGACAVGASAWFFTPAYGFGPPPGLNAYSSWGGVPIVFDANGALLPAPIAFNKPEFVAPDGGNNTFFGFDISQDADVFPNFFGTSASAPHAAAAAALIFEANPGFTKDDVKRVLINTAVDMLSPGFDFGSGAGLINVGAAVSSALPLLAAPNCQDLNTSIGPDGIVRINLSDFIGNAGVGIGELQVTVHRGPVLITQLSGVYATDYLLIPNACTLVGEELKVTISNALGSCWSLLTLNDNLPLLVGRTVTIYCDDELVQGGEIGGTLPAVQATCSNFIPTVQFVADWVTPYDCEPGQDTAKIIYREYEAFDKLGRRASVFDTLIVMRIPQLHFESFFCPGNLTLYCGDTSGFLSPSALFSNGSMSGYVEFVELVNNNGELQFLPVVLDPKCGLQVHVDYKKFGSSSCQVEYKVSVEVKQICPGSLSSLIVSVISPNDFEALDADSTYWLCEFWVTDLDTLPPVAICKGEPFFKGPLELDNWTFNTLRDFDFLHEEDFLGGLVQGLPPFEDLVIPDELTMLDTSKVPYSMCFASEQIIENPDIYLGLNTAFIVAEQDMEFTFDWDFLLGEFDADNGLLGVPGAIGLIGYGINGTFYKLVEGIEEPLLDQWAEYQEFLDQVMGELEIDEELCNLNISLFLEDSWGGTTIRLDKGDVFTLFGLWVSNSDAKIQFSGENLITTTTHECAAHAYVPPLLVKEDWSGIKQVKATIESIGTVILEYDAITGCYISHEPLKLPYRDDPYQITYEVYDSCHNIGYEYCYLKVKDKTPPVAIADKGVTVSLSDKKVWVDASTFDEGSWDNCGVNFVLARRADWQVACVDLCYNHKEESNCNPSGPEDYESAIRPIWTDGHDTLWCLDLEEDKHCDPVESHYVKQMEWLCEDDLPCGELIYNGWSYDLLRYATIQCRDNHYLDDAGFRQLLERALQNPDADPNDHLDGLIEEKFKCVLPRANAECILPFTFGRFPLLEFLPGGPMLPIPIRTPLGSIEMMYLPQEQAFCGYNEAQLKYHLDEWSQIGGGWSDAVPFSCEDACGPVTVEILVMDYWCNWTKAWTEVWVEDKTPVQVVKEVVEQELITCKVYRANNYSYPGEQHPVSIEYIVEQAKTGAPEALSSLDAIFGGYCKAWIDPYGKYVDADGVEIDCDIPFYDSVCYCSSYYKQVRIYDDHLGYLWVDSLVTDCYYAPDTLNFLKGIIAVNCAENVYCEQDVWSEFDHCGQGYIFRKFKIFQSCPPAEGAEGGTHIRDTIYRTQRIWVGNECELNKYMFEVPSDIEVYTCHIEYGTDGNVTGDAGPENTGYATYKFDDDCRIVGIAHEDKVFKIVGGEEACYKILRTWYFADWCGYGGDVATGKWWLDAGIVIDQCVQKIIVKDTVAPICIITGPVETGSSVDLGSCEFDLEVRVDASDACGLTSYLWELKDVTDPEDPYARDSGSGTLSGEEEEDFAITPAGLSPGTYKLTVQVRDECTNESYCEYIITVNTGKKPTPVCITSLTARLTPWDTDGDGEVDSAHALVWAYEFDRSSIPACEDDSLEYRIAFLTGTEDDATPAGDQDFLEVGCADIGTRVVRIWMISHPSLTRDYCDAVLIVQTDFSGCNTQGSGEDGMTLEENMTHTQSKPGLDRMPGDPDGITISGDAGLLQHGRGSSFTLGQNQPNPFRYETVIGFTLPEAMSAHLSIFDVTGRLMKRVEGDFPRGYNQVVIDREDLRSRGVLYYQLETSDYLATKKMVLIE